MLATSCCIEKLVSLLTSYETVAVGLNHRQNFSVSVESLFRSNLEAALKFLILF